MIRAHLRVERKWGTAMPIPSTRQELKEMVCSAFANLVDELHNAGSEIGQLHCIDEWDIKDLLAVRAWWTESVLDWIKMGRRGDSPDLPAPAYTWQETPRLNADIVENAKSESYEEVLARLHRGYRLVLATIDELDDKELLEEGVFGWAGKWPIARWISLNTARQYTTARTFIRRARRQARDP